MRIGHRRFGPERGTRAFVFVAALGVMAVGLLIAFAMSSSVQFTYHRTAASLGDAQAHCLVQSGVDYALHQFAQNRIAADGKLRSFAIRTDQLRGTKLTGDVAVFRLTGDHPMYQLVALEHRPGDLLVYVGSVQLEEQQGRVGRYLLCNTEGQRARPIDVTPAIPYVPGGMVLEFSS